MKKKPLPRLTNQSGILRLPLPMQMKPEWMGRKKRWHNLPPPVLLLPLRKEPMVGPLTGTSLTKKKSKQKCLEPPNSLEKI